MKSPGPNLRHFAENTLEIRDGTSVCGYVGVFVISNNQPSVDYRM
jgi:hypothetical protein